MMHGYQCCVWSDCYSTRAYLQVVGSTFRAMADLAKEKNDGKDVGHLRKGDVGDWRNHFSPTLSAQFDAEYARQFAGTGLEYDLGEGETLRA
jgi:hypothetical protein